MQKNENLNPDELNVSSITPLEELKAEEKPTSKLGEPTEEDLNKKTYLEVNPRFYIKAVESEEGEEDVELFKILNPETQEVEVRELSDDEKKELYIKQLKESRKVFNPIKHNGNTTTNQFGSKYKQNRKRKNRQAKASRKANR